MARIDVLTGIERRRRWSEDQKRAVVAAAFAPGAVVAQVARRADNVSYFSHNMEWVVAPGFGYVGF